MLISINIINQRTSDEGQRTFIPWTNILADIAAENVVADRRAKLFRDGSSQFDVEIGYTARGVHDVGFGEGLSGTSIGTVRTGAATVGGGNVHGQFQACENHPEK